jgi:molybdenum cofactor cytidylyltransferase
LRNTTAAVTERTTGLVLAAGGSKRLGEPKQLLPYRGATLLDAVLDTARASPFDQRIVTLGGAAEDIRAKVDLTGFDTVFVESFGEGCSSSIAAALSVTRGDVLVLLLGDQPGVTPQHVEALLEGRGTEPLAACRYDDGRGHPLAFGRETFAELRELHGDKGVWRLLDRSEVVEVPVEGAIPRDVDTLDDYRALT